MKTTILTVALTVVCAVTPANSFGQAQIEFLNGGNPVVYPPYYYASDANLPIYGSAGTWEFGLYMGAYGSTSISQMQLIDTVLSVATTSPASLFAGFINGGTVNSPGNVANALDFQAGTTYSFIVAAWPSVDGNSFSQVFGAPGYGDGLFGLSALGYITPSSGGCSPVPQLFGSGPGQIGGFSVPGAAPEPKTVVLGVVGAAILWLFRRRK